jgi:hypothetical protein
MITLLVLPLFLRHRRSKFKRLRGISVVSKRMVSRVSQHELPKDDTQVGYLSRNELDTHADTSCACANWCMELTGEICEVTPFHTSYTPMQAIPVAQCCTVYTLTQTGREYLIVCDQMLWFGQKLNNSLLNPNQMRVYGIDVNDDPFDDTQQFGIAHDEIFIPAPRGLSCILRVEFLLTGNAEIYRLSY